MNPPPLPRTFTLLTALLLASAAGAATITCPDPANGITTPQHALDAAASGDVIVLLQGEYRGNFVVDGKSDLTIRGQGLVVLDARPLGATASGPALVATNCPDLRVELLTLRNAGGIDDAGAGLALAASPRVILERLTITGCATQGLFADACDALRMTDCEVRGNAGGVHVAGNFATLVRVTVEQDAGGGIVMIGDDARVEHARVALIRGGGGIDITGERPTVWKCEVASVLDAGTNGITTSGAHPDLRGNRVRGCDTGIYVVYGAHGRVKNNEVIDCTASGLRLGGASFELTIDKNLVDTCGRPDAPGYWIDGTSQLIADNRAQRCGGDGFRVVGASCTLRGNAASGNLRDGIDVDAVASDTVLEANLAKGNRAEGIENSGTATRLSGNQAKKNSIDFAADGTSSDEGGNDFVVAGAPLPEID